MQKIVVHGKCNMNLLHEELVAQVPTFRRVTTLANGEFLADGDHGRVVRKGDVVTLWFADDIDPSLVQAVVDAHDCTGRSYNQVRSDRREELKAKPVLTNDELRELWELLGLTGAAIF